MCDGYVDCLHFVFLGFKMESSSKAQKTFKVTLAGNDAVGKTKYCTTVLIKECNCWLITFM